MYIRVIIISFLVLVTSIVAMAAAETVRVLMEEPALRSVSPQVFDTAVPVHCRLLENTARVG